VSGTLKTVLLVGNVFEPCGYWAVEQRRWDGFRRYLPSFGWRPLILVKACNCCLGSSEESDAFRIGWREDPREAALRVSRAIADWPADKPVVVMLECAAAGWLRAWLVLARLSGYRFAREEWRCEVFHLVHPMPSLDGKGARLRWALPVAKALGLLVGRVHEQGRIDWLERGTALGRELGRSAGVRVTVGSYPSIHNQVIARRVAGVLGVPWIADFRDSIARGWSGPARDAGRVRRLLRDCATTVYVTPHEARRDAGLHGRPYHVVENGFAETEEFAERRRRYADHRNDKLTIRYLGTVYPAGNIDVFLDGLALLAGRDHQMVSDLRFEYIGPSGEAMAASVSARGIDALVTIRPPVPFAEAQDLMLRADALVMRTNCQGLHGAPGAKLYEYLGSRKPILAAGFKDDYVVGVFNRTGTGCACDSAEEVVETLESWWAQWRDAGRVDLAIREEEILKHSREQSAGALATVLDEVGGLSVIERSSCQVSPGARMFARNGGGPPSPGILRTMRRHGGR